jgi:hypothetical protein
MISISVIFVWAILFLDNVRFGDEVCNHFSDDDLEEKETMTLEGIKTKVMLLNDKIQNKMWFV